MFTTEKSCVSGPTYLLSTVFQGVPVLSVLRHESCSSNGNNTGSVCVCVCVCVCLGLTCCCTTVHLTSYLEDSSLVFFLVSDASDPAALAMSFKPELNLFCTTNLHLTCSACAHIFVKNNLNLVIAFCLQCYYWKKKISYFNLNA